MAFDPLSAVGDVSNLLRDAIDKIWPNPEDKAKAEAVAMAAATDSAVQTLKAQIGVMMAEANSADPWTSRARPSFLYVMYTMILISIPYGILWAFEPAIADRMANGLKAWLGAIPDPLWQTFMVGYLGYTLARGSDKAGGVLPFITGKK
jgi:Holin of 3TMs, for gene-transfer release